MAFFGAAFNPVYGEVTKPAKVLLKSHTNANDPATLWWSKILGKVTYCDIEIQWKNLKLMQRMP